MPYFLGAYRTSYLEGYLFGGLYAWRAVFCVCDFLSFLSPWMDQLSVCVIFSLSCLRGWINFLFATRWSTPFMEIIIPIPIYGDHNPYSILHIPYSMLYAIYDLEGSNDSDVNLQSTEFDPCR